MLFVLALQQLDGNVIGPKILGDKTGLSSLWVIIAILVSPPYDPQSVEEELAAARERN